MGYVLMKVLRIILTKISDMQTKPIISIPTPLSSSLAHLHFIPKSPEGDTTMVVDSSCPSRYLVIGLVRFEARKSQSKLRSAAKDQC